MDDTSIILRIKSKVTLVIPTYSEAKNLPHVLPKIPKCVDEVIIVDGHSKDDTIKVAKELCPRAKIILQDGTGKGNALKCGYENATGNIIVQIDADGSMDPEEITGYLHYLNDGYDIVKGSRLLPGGGSKDISKVRVLGNHIFAICVNILFKTRYTDLCYGFIGFKRESIDKLDLKSDGFNIETEICIKAKTRGLKVKEIPSFEEKRLYGSGGLRSIRDGRHIGQTIIREFINEKIKTNKSSNLKKQNTPAAVYNPNVN
jgi:glycosyltransferase involved in cell wall biosynthesis